MEERFNRAQARREAREALAAARPRAVWVTLLFGLLTVLPPLAAMALALGSLWDLPFLLPAQVLLLEALALLCALYSLVAWIGYLSYSLRLSRREEAGCWCLLEGFSMPGRMAALALALVVRLLPWGLGMGLLASLGVLAVEAWGPWGLLAALPCALLCFLLLLWLLPRYALLPFLFLDQPGLGALQAISRSIALMRGRKAALWKLWLSFLGWGLLTALTLGLLGLWTRPYFWAAAARFYDWILDQEETHMPLTF